MVLHAVPLNTNYTACARSSVCGELVCMRHRSVRMTARMHAAALTTHAFSQKFCYHGAAVPQIIRKFSRRRGRENTKCSTGPRKSPLPYGSSNLGCVSLRRCPDEKNVSCGARSLGPSWRLSFSLVLAQRPPAQHDAERRARDGLHDHDLTPLHSQPDLYALDHRRHDHHRRRCESRSLESE